MVFLDQFPIHRCPGTSTHGCFVYILKGTCRKWRCWARELEGHCGSWLKQPKVRVFPRVPSRRMKNEVESRGKGRKALSKARTGSNALEGRVSTREKEEPGASSFNSLRLPLRGMCKLQEDANLGPVHCTSPACVKQGRNC